MADQELDPQNLPKTFAALRGFDASHYKRTERYAKQVQKLFDTATQELCGLATRWQETIATDPDEPFAFDAFPRTKRQAQGFITRLVGKVTSTIEQATRQEWLAACSKNDAFLGNILRTSKLTPDEVQQYQDRNIEALSSFQKRKSEGMNLSDRVWRIADSFKNEMETAIDVALGDGRAAAELSRDVRGLLNQPDKLFRRVRDKATGELRLSKAAAAYHPGQGVYRSSYLNAMRLARTEVNMAYRQAEYLRWQQLDFVVGFRIWLSNNHTRLNSKGKPEPFEDICDQLAGDYPKTFKFLGWHPQCRCVVTPIMASYKEYNDQRAGRLKAIVRGETYKSLPARRTVTDVPGKFRTYIQSIADRSKGWKNQPYYIRDNFKGGTIDGGLNPVIPQRGGQITGTTKAPAPQPCTKFDKQIAKYKALAYTFGLDCSPLDALRTAGDEAALEAKLDELGDLQVKRYSQWLDAEKEFTDFYQSLPPADIDLLNAFLDKFGEGYKNNKYAVGRYYADCIANLKATVAAAKMWYAQRQAAKAEAKQELDRSEKMEERLRDVPTELRPGSDYMDGDNYEFNNDFFRLQKMPAKLVIKKNDHGSFCRASAYPPQVVIQSENRNKRGTWHRKSVIYHEYGHAIAEKRDLLFDNATTELRQQQIDRMRTREKAVWTTEERMFDYEENKWIIKRVKHEKNQMRILTISSKISNIYKRLRRKADDDPIFERAKKRYGLNRFDIQEQISNVADTLRSLVNRSDVGWGHKVSYFNDSGSKEHEYLAHCFENAFLGNLCFRLLLPVEYEEMRQLVLALKEP